MTRVLCLGLAAALWLGRPSPCFGQEKASDEAGLFAQLDANQDLQVTSDEVPQESKSLFERLVQQADADGNGSLSLDEMQAGLSAEPDRPLELTPERPAAGRGREAAAAMFGRLDADGDGRVSLSEVPEERRERFERMLDRADKNDDDSLTREEFAGAFERLAGNPPGDERPPGKKKNKDKKRARPDGDRWPLGDERRPGPGDGPPGPPRFPNPLIRALDTDGDHSISSEEIANSAESLKSLDHNDDGKLDRSELAPPRPDGPPGGPGFGGPPVRRGPPDGDGPPRLRADDRPDRPERPGDERRPPRPERDAAPGPMPGEIIARIMEKDADGDGQLNKEEAPERIKRIFDSFDANGDGFIDKAELSEQIGGMRERIEGRRPEGRPRGPRPRPDGAPGAPGRPGHPGRPPRPEGPPPEVNADETAAGKVIERSI